MGGMGGFPGGGFSYSSTGGRSSPFGGASGNPFGGFGMDDFQNFNFDDSGRGGGMPFGAGGGGRKPETITKPIPISLQDLYKGITKRLKVTRTVYDKSGGSRQESNVLELNIQPGWKAGMKITFPEAGDVYPGAPTADMAFVIEEKPHEYFKREGDDLIYTARITLSQALTGVKISVPLLDGTNCEVSIRDKVIEPGAVHRVKGAGMPNRKQKGAFGDLVIKFEVQFPRTIPEDDKAQLKKILANAY
uniref:Chaperone DnaJ C-terminal domain-containing protein n=1 Tax=Arcella intermedia TaxID=1963864 RepID=A0A6B2LF44_9EUKA